MDTLKPLTEQLISGQADEVGRLTRQALDDELDPLEILNRGLIPGMDEVGRRFKDGEMYVPDVLIAARAMRAGMEVLRPLLAQSDVSSLGTVILGTIQGDLHDIGKNLVGIMLKGAGFEVIDLGNDVAPERFVDAAAEEGAHVIGMSALLTTTMPTMKAVVELLEGRGFSDDVKTIVGGAPVSADFAREIGADAYGFDAANAVVRVKELMDIS